MELLGFCGLTQVYTRPHNFRCPPLSLDKQLQHVLDTFASRLREEVTHQVRVVGDELAAEARADRAAAEQPPSTGRLTTGIRAMSGARSLSDVLDALVSCAGREAARAGVMLVRGDRFRRWSLVGFDPSFESGDALDIVFREAGVIAEAVRSAAVASSEPDGGVGAPAFAQLPAGQSCVAVPISVGGQVVAVLYADAGLESGTVNAEPLEILACFASQRLEALTAVKAARSLIGTTDRPAPRPDPSDGEADEHAAARRYARLLVSEIKLYNESQVAEGRREGDLATRLGGEIARVRTLYDQRVSAEVRQSRDYVHEELIRTLADGDASLLDMKT